MIGKYLKAIAALLLAMALSACGSGESQTAVHTQTAALKTVGALAPGQLIGSMDLTLNLPSGVTVPADASGRVFSGVVTITGVADPAMTMCEAMYTPANGVDPGTLHLVVINAMGFGAGEFVTIKLTVGPNVHANGFSLPQGLFHAGDLNGNDISSSLTATMTATIN